MIQAHMENICFSRFSTEDLETTSDESIIKVVALAQLCMEFLMATCAESQHLIQGLTERVRIQAAQLKVASATSRRERPRRTPERTAPLPQGLVRKCPHCPKRFQSEQYLNDHMLRRHIASIFEPPPVAPWQAEKPVESEAVVSPRPGVDSSEISEVVKNATQDLHGSMQEGLQKQEGITLQLLDVQRSVQEAIQNMEEKVASAIDNVRQDVGKQLAMTTPPVSPPADTKGPSFDLSLLEKHMETLMDEKILPRFEKEAALREVLPRHAHPAGRRPRKLPGTRKTLWKSSKRRFRRRSNR